MNTNNITNTDPTAAQQSALASVVNALSLQSPQRFARPLASAKARALKKAAALQACPSALQLADLPQGNPPVIHLEHSVELTYGPDPQKLVQRAMSKVSHPALKAFLKTVMAQNLVNLVLTMPPMNNQRVQPLPIDRLRSTAEEAMRWCDLSKGERETLYVAILVAGIELMLGQTLTAAYSSREVIDSAVRPALRKLDATNLEQASALRNVLGWGNEDEMIGLRTAQAQSLVCQAVRTLRERMVLTPKVCRD